MEQKNAKDFEDQVNDLVSRLRSRDFFQSQWDVAAFALFFIFIGELTGRRTSGFYGVRVCNN